LDLASSLYKVHRVETTVPRNLEIVRLRWFYISYYILNKITIQIIIN
jgi:hypothetical protein